MQRVASSLRLISPGATGDQYTATNDENRATKANDGRIHIKIYLYVRFPVQAWQTALVSFDIRVILSDHFTTDNTVEGELVTLHQKNKWTPGIRVESLVSPTLVVVEERTACG